LPHEKFKTSLFLNPQNARIPALALRVQRLKSSRFILAVERSSQQVDNAVIGRAGQGGLEIEPDTLHSRLQEAPAKTKSAPDQEKIRGRLKRSKYNFYFDTLNERYSRGRR
jgi:hypothetical protein